MRRAQGQVPGPGVSPNAKGGSKLLPGTRTRDRWWSVVQLLAEQHRHSIQGGKGGHRAPGLLLPPFQGVSPPSGLLRCRQPFTVRSSVYLFTLRLLQPSLVLIVGWNLSLAPLDKTDNTLPIRQLKRARINFNTYFSRFFTKYFPVIEMTNAPTISSA